MSRKTGPEWSPPVRKLLPGSLCESKKKIQHGLQNNDLARVFSGGGYSTVHMYCITPTGGAGISFVK